MEKEFNGAFKNKLAAAESVVVAVQKTFGRPIRVAAIGLGIFEIFSIEDNKKIATIEIREK